MVRNLVATAVSLFVAFVLLLVGARFLALLASANANSEIIERIYRHSDFWVKPFFGTFGLANEAVDGGGVFEPASLLAIAVYFAVGALVLAVLSSVPFHIDRRT